MREVDRRKLNVIEGLILTALVGLGASNLLLRDSVVQVKAQNDALVTRIEALSGQMSDLPTRVSKLEIKQEADADAIKELRQMKGLR